jgi:NAD(P)-dependent dehydrogenase (short-subunit alcohol dehydrogenase family)
MPSQFIHFSQHAAGRVILLKLDTRSQADVDRAVNRIEQILGSKGLDVLVKNAAVMSSTVDNIQTMDDLNEVFDVNVTCAHRMTTAFLPLLQKGSLKKVIIMYVPMLGFANSTVFESWLGH